MSATSARCSGGEHFERPLEVPSHDRFGPAQALEGHEPDRAGASLLLDVPEAFEHELEERRLYPTGFVLSGYDAPPTEPVLDPPRCNLVEHRLDELGLRAVRLLLRRELVEPL